MISNRNSIKYKLIVVLLLFLLLISLAFNLIQRQMHLEFIEANIYQSNIVKNTQRVKAGMSKVEIIKIIGYEPDKITEEIGKTSLHWSYVLRQGKITKVFNKHSAKGAYWLTVVLDKNNKVVEVDGGNM